MLLAHSMGKVTALVPETAYRTEYEILQSTKERESNKEVEFGISCRLFKAEEQVDFAVVNDISTQRTRVERFLHILEKNQVFPVHLKDVVEDLLILEFEGRDCKTEKNNV